MGTTYATPLHLEHDFSPVYHHSDYPSHNAAPLYQVYGESTEGWNESDGQTGLSLFAQTMLEQDREFYRQFPDAKRAQIEQWEQELVLQDTHSESPRFEYYDERSVHPTASHYGQPVTPSGPPVSISESPVYAAPEPLMLDSLYYDYMQAPGESSTSIAHSPGHVWDERPVEYAQSPPESPLPTTPSSPVLNIESHRLVPSNHRQLSRSYSQPGSAQVQRRTRGRPRSIGSIASSTMVPPPNVTFINNNSVQLTGHWSTDAKAAECLLHAPAPRRAQVPGIIADDSSPVVNVPSTRRHHLTHRLRKAVRAHSHPYSRSNSPSSPPERRSSPVARKPKSKSKTTKPKISVDGSRKPLLACLFCRGRKIACGPPPSGSNNPSCDQCLKRDIECTYPLESHRGLRKKKPETEIELNAVIIQAAGLDHDDPDADAEGEDDLEE